MNNLVKTNIPWLPYIKSDWKIVKVKSIFYASKEKAHQVNPTILSLARSGVKVRDISNNEGQLAESYFDYNPVKPGDLLLNPMDLYSGANCNVSEVEGVISPAYANLRSKIKLEPKFFDYYFKSQYWTMAMFAHGKGVSFDNRWTLNNETLMGYELPFPSYEEQEKIVKVLKTEIVKIDDLILIQERQIEKLKDYKNSMIYQFVSGKRNNELKKETIIRWADKIPSSWKVLSLKKGANIKTGSTPSTSIPEYFDGNIEWYTPGDFVSDEISSSNRHISTLALIENNIEIFPAGTTLLIGIGGTAGKVCKITKEGYFNQQITALVAKENINKDYLFYLMLGVKQYLKDNALFTTLPIINNQYLSNFLIPVPNLMEQGKIVDSIINSSQKIDNLIKIKQQKIEKLQEYKKSLIYEYVTGKREVKEG